MKTDDGEGSIHHDVPNHRIDVQILDDMTNKKPSSHSKSCHNYPLSADYSTQQTVRNFSDENTPVRTC